MVQSLPLYIKEKRYASLSIKETINVLDQEENYNDFFLYSDIGIIGEFSNNPFECNFIT
ncbi:hypothetical protein LSP03_33500 [Lysinibacillus sphaericus]|nr:hypothetical protein LSP03_33500 [Lysinibacillus sphaericus]